MTEQREVHTVKMAKAPKEEWKALLDFFQKLEEMVEADPWNSEIGEYVVDKMRGDVGAGYSRVLWGFDTLVENVCDPTLDYLEWKPELRDIKEQRDEARRWSAAWKRAAKDNKAKLLHAVIKYKLQNRTVKKERDEARRRIAELEAVIADMLDHLTDVLWYPNDDPQVEALRSALDKGRKEAA